MFLFHAVMILLRIHHNFLGPTTPWHPEHKTSESAMIGHAVHDTQSGFNPPHTYNVGPMELFLQPENGQPESSSGCGGTYDS